VHARRGHTRHLDSARREIREGHDPSAYVVTIVRLLERTLGERGDVNQS
jgi:hypothetical protein